MNSSAAVFASLEPLFSLKQPQAMFVLLLSVLVPLSIFVGRRNVRLRRLRMLRNLQRVLPPAPGQGASLSSAAMPGFAMPGFAMIEARYLDETEGQPVWRRFGGWIKEIGIYTLPTLVFVLVSGCGFALLFELGDNWLSAAQILLQGLRSENGNAAAPFASTTALVMAAGFAGAYIWSVNYLILRIANFDLSPLSFLSTAAHILMTVFVSWVLRQVVATPDPGQAIAVAVLLGVVFLSGLYPSLGLNVLIDRLPSWLRFKRDIPNASAIARSFPLDLLDGIDITVKFRLNGLDVADVQNLATANPLELFVETPYGFSQILDWMAQAQLLAELGPERFLQARNAGIRDMMAFLDLGKSDAGRALMKAALATPGNPDLAVTEWIDTVASKLSVRQLVHWVTLLSQTFDKPPLRAVAVDSKVTPLQPTG